MSSACKCLLIVLIALAISSACFKSSNAEEKAQIPPFEPYVPAFSTDEKIEYSVYWRGIKIGSQYYWTDAIRKVNEPFQIHFTTKTSRLGKWLYSFFSGSVSTSVSPVDGATQKLSRTLDWESLYLNEEVTHDYDRMELRQTITFDRRRPPALHFRPIPSKMHDPLSALMSLRFKRFAKIGDKREFYVFAQNFWTLSIEVTGRKTSEYPEIGMRDVWICIARYPIPGLKAECSSEKLEIDVQTGIMLQSEWETSSGSLRATIEDARNVSLPFPVEGQNLEN